MGLFLNSIRTHPGKDIRAAPWDDRGIFYIIYRIFLDRLSSAQPTHVPIIYGSPIDRCTMINIRIPICFATCTLLPMNCP